MIRRIALQNISRCQSCKLSFQNLDCVVVRTTGTHEWTDKNSGECKTSTINVYTHFLRKCLEDNDGAFRFENIIVLKDTLKLLPASASEKFQKHNLKFE